MRFGSIIRGFCALVLAALACAPAMRAQTFDLDRGREPIVSLDGRWRFHAGDSPVEAGSGTDGGKRFAWAEPGFDDSTWPLLKSNESWSVQGYPDMSGYGWYRFSVHIPAGSAPTSLLLAPIVTSFDVFVDGRLVSKQGAVPHTLIPNTKFFPVSFRLTDSVSTASRTVEVAIRVWHSPMWATYMGGGPFRGGHLAGARSFIAIEQAHESVARNVIFVDYYSYSIAAALVGFAILCLFFFRQADREYLWFALILMAQAADSALNVSKEIYAIPPIPIFDLLDGILEGLMIVAAMLFFSRVLRAHVGKMGKVFLALVVLSPLPGIAYWPGLLSPALGGSIQFAMILPAALWIFALLFKRALAGDLDARLLLLPTLLDLGYYVADNVTILIGQFGWISDLRMLEIKIPLPPFTVQLAIFLHLFFLLAMLVFLIRRFTYARRREERLNSELEAARQVQLVLLPDQQDQCAGFTVDSIYQPADQVGGDFFQQISDGQCGMLVVVGDVSGKGLPAAMLVSVLVGAIRAEAAHSTDPVAILRSLNQRLMGRSHGGFTTCMAAHVTSSGLLTVANAGHLAPYLNGEELAVPAALPLGITDGTNYERATFQLKPGDRLTFVSDGVVEAQSKGRELFGFERTREISGLPAAAIAEAARAFGQNDDITVVTVQFGSP